MKRQIILILAIILALAACAPTTETVVETVVVTQQVEGETVVVVENAAVGFEPVGRPASQAQAVRLIIKDGQITLLVERTDLAIDLATQVVTDTGGYIISSRIWYEEWGGEMQQYASYSVAVPVDRFESTMSRLRGLAVHVLDESASGEDVTDQFVDLESRLDNLKATRDRIRVFLDQAETVEEALDVNEELAEVESEIELIQGRLNYLADRAAFSTIRITLEPELPELPAPTPAPWSVSENYQNAARTLGNVYKGILNALIWVFVVGLPVVVPLVLVVWAGRRWVRRNR